MMSASFRAPTTTSAEDHSNDPNHRNSEPASTNVGALSEEEEASETQRCWLLLKSSSTLSSNHPSHNAAYGSLATTTTDTNNRVNGTRQRQRMEDEHEYNEEEHNVNHDSTSPLLRPLRELPSHISLKAQSSSENSIGNHRKRCAGDDSLAIFGDNRKNYEDIEDDNDNEKEEDDDQEEEDDNQRIILTLCDNCKVSLPPLRQMALTLSLWINIIITLAKFVAYLQTFSLSVLAALLDSVLDTVSQLVLGYTEHHSTKERSSAFYPAGASRLEAIGVLGIAALMGMASFEVLKDSIVALISNQSPFASSSGSSSGAGGAAKRPSLSSFWSMLAIVMVKILLLMLCTRAASKRSLFRTGAKATASLEYEEEDADEEEEDMETGISAPTDVRVIPTASAMGAGGGGGGGTVQLADPTLQALAQDHFNDALSNGVAAVALLFALRQPSLWFLDPIGAICISLYIIYSWFMTGREQIEQLIGKSAPDDFIAELTEIARVFDERIVEVDVVRAYHFGPKFLVEIEIVMPKETSLFESHDVGMELQYEIEAREEVERCFVHIDYQQRPYDEHVVSKVPELREKYRPKGKGLRSVQSV